jgi:hypothetical protein
MVIISYCHCINALECEPSHWDKAQSNTAEGNAAESNTAESNAAESNTAESNAAEGNAAESNTTESNAAESITAESIAAENIATESITAESVSAESNATESNAAESAALLRMQRFFCFVFIPLILIHQERLLCGLHGPAFVLSVLHADQINISLGLIRYQYSSYKLIAQTKLNFVAAGLL